MPSKKAPKKTIVKPAKAKAPAAKAASMAKVQGGVAIVTGGSRGIGAACCKLLAGRGYCVVVVYRSGAAEAEAVLGEIKEAGGKAVICKCDVSKEADVVKLFKTADTAFGKEPLAAVVNNAGVLGPRGGLSEVGTAAQLNDVLATNVTGPMLCCREAERRMSTARGGRGGAIVQVSSGSAYIGSPLLYGTSKGALNSLTIGLVKPLAQVGIRINTVSPGMTETDMIADMAPGFDLTQARPRAAPPEARLQPAPGSRSVTPSPPLRSIMAPYALLRRSLSAGSASRARSPTPSAGFARPSRRTSRAPTSAWPVDGLPAPPSAEC